jgi:hypothetical protein
MQKHFVAIYLLPRRVSLELIHTQGFRDWMTTEGLHANGIKWGKMKAMLFVWKSTTFNLRFYSKSL